MRNHQAETGKPKAIRAPKAKGSAGSTLGPGLLPWRFMAGGICGRRDSPCLLEFGLRPVYRLGVTRILALAIVLAVPAFAEDLDPPLPMDLPTALRLAGAQNLEVQRARESLAEAQAAHLGALAQFFPWIAPGIGYRRHDNLVQDTSGNILSVHKDSYAPGGTLATQVELGDAIYKTRAARQRVQAAGHGLESQRQAATLAAALGYLDLAQTAAAVGVAREAVRISADYEAQLDRAVEAGLAFRGDRVRVQVQTERNRLALRTAEEQQRLAAARLAEVLDLDPARDLAPQETELVPLALVDTNAALGVLIQQTLAARPEVLQSLALAASAREARKGAVYGPLIPTVGASAFFGGLGGGPAGVPDRFGEQQDYSVGLSWRIGPGGLFDAGRRRAAEARWKLAAIDAERVRDAVRRQVVEAFTRWQSQADQLVTARRALVAAGEGLRLARERKEFAVGMVLENIQAEQDLTRARLDYLEAVAEFDKAQYALLGATGRL
ncbi:MAG: TolC family protein [Verrucomicrobia bacterium]|nr:TolC family protein [Verrucomicrobiota bacterium]